MTEPPLPAPHDGRRAEPAGPGDGRRAESAGPGDGRRAESAGPDDGRRAELAANLARVRSRIDAACASAGRDPAGVTMVAVTKTYPASDVLLLAGLGVRDVAENRDQEAAPKAAEVAATGTRLRWHFVGQLQRNKARSVVRYADLVHSVDSVRLAGALADAATRHREHPLEVLVQVNLDGAADRGGAVLAENDPDRGFPQVVAAVAGSDRLRLAGVMAVAPLGADPEPAFATLAEVAAGLRAEHPGAVVVSAGMSGDLETAIAYGATHVRIGSALLGMRDGLR